jgi:hypothetical protein
MAFLALFELSLFAYLLARTLGYASAECGAAAAESLGGMSVDSAPAERKRGIGNRECP